MGFASLLAPSPIRTETDLYSLSSLLSLKQSPGSLLALNFLTLPEGSLPSLASGQHVDHYMLFLIFFEQSTTQPFEGCLGSAQWKKYNLLECPPLA